MTRCAVDDGVTGERRSLCRTGVAAVVATDFGDRIGAVAAGWIGQRLKDAGLYFGHVKEFSARDVELGEFAEQYRCDNQQAQCAGSNEQPQRALRMFGGFGAAPRLL